MDESGVLRSCESEVKKRAAQFLGLGGDARVIHLAGEPDALDGDRGLIHQRVEKPALVGRQE